MSGRSFDREKIHLNIAHIKKEGHKFEIDVDVEKAIAFKQGKADISEVLKVQHIFSDIRKGELASEQLMKKIFGTSDALEVAKIILQKGELPLTTEYRKKMLEDKKKQIIHLIHKNCVDPKTHLPHPITRIENAINEAKVKINEHKSAEDQIQDIINQLRPILPIKFEIKEIEINIAPEYAAKCFSTIKSFGSIKKDSWKSNGLRSIITEIPGGLEQELYDKLNAITHGNIETKVIRTK